MSDDTCEEKTAHLQLNQTSCLPNLWIFKLVGQAAENDMNKVARAVEVQ